MAWHGQGDVRPAWWHVSDYQGGMVLKRRIIIILGSAFLIGQRRMRVF